MDGQKKNQSSLTVLAVVVLVSGGIIIGFNYWHAMKCVEQNGLGDMEDYIKALEKRIALVELQGLSNTLLTDNLLSEMQSRFTSLDPDVMNRLLERSKDEAVQMALSQASLPAPPISQYIIEDKYQYNSFGGDQAGSLMDDLFDPDSLKEGEQYFDMAGQGWEGGEGGGGGELKDDFKFDDFTGAGGEGGGGLGELDGGRKDDFWEDPAGGEGSKLSEEAADACREWRDNYGVVPGVSWGSLPKAMQKDWSRNHCDQLK
jgi:hypothetical protein